MTTTTATPGTAQSLAKPKGSSEKQCPICRGTGLLSVAVAPGETYDRPVTENIGCYRCGGKGTIHESVPS